MKKWIVIVMMGLGCVPAMAQGVKQENKAKAEALAPKEKTIWERDFLTGDWGGERTKLEEKGIVFSINYTADLLSNVSGGVRRGTAYTGLLEVGIDLDFEKLAGWKGGSFHANTLWTHGPSPTGKYIGDFTTASSIDAYDTVQLFEAWYQHNFLDDKIQVRAGQLAMDESFATSDLGATFLNATFGYPTSVSAFDGHPQYATAGLGAQVRIEPKFEAAKGLYLQTGVFEGNPGGAANTSGGALNTSGIRYDAQFGVVGGFELGYRLDESYGWKGLPGSYKVGAYYHTDGNQRPPLAYLDASGKTQEDNYTIYLMGEQMVWKEKGEGFQGLSVFSAFSTAPSAVNAVHFYAAGGISYKGLLPSRDDDIFGLAVAYADQSNGSQIANTGVADDSSEVTFEATYLIQIAPWWSFQPDLQYIVNPGFVTSSGDAVVVGARTSISF